MVLWMWSTQDCHTCIYCTVIRSIYDTQCDHPHANLSPALSSYQWGFPATPLLSEGNSSTGSGLQQCPTRDQDDRDIRPNDQTWGRWHLGRLHSHKSFLLAQVFVWSRLTPPFPLSVTYVSMFGNNALLGGGVRVRACIRNKENIKRRSKALLSL